MCFLLHERLIRAVMCTEHFQTPTVRRTFALAMQEHISVCPRSLLGWWVRQRSEPAPPAQASSSRVTCAGQWQTRVPVSQEETSPWEGEVIHPRSQSSQGVEPASHTRLLPHTLGDLGLITPMVKCRHLLLLVTNSTCN